MKYYFCEKSEINIFFPIIILEVKGKKFINNLVILVCVFFNINLIVCDKFNMQKMSKFCDVIHFIEFISNVLDHFDKVFFTNLT